MATGNNPIQIIVRIAFFRDQPQNLPAANHLVMLSALAALLSTVFLSFSIPLSKGLQLAALQVIVYGLVVAAVLAFGGHLARWRQTISAIYGTNCVLRCLAYFPVLLVSSLAQEEEKFFWSTAIEVPFGIWGLVISAYIFREAMEISNTKAFFLALGVNLAVSLVVLMFIGGSDRLLIE